MGCDTLDEQTPGERAREDDEQDNGPIARDVILLMSRHLEREQEEKMIKTMDP